MTLANASGLASFSNAAISSNVGGRPVRSSEARRIRSRLEACFTGFSPSRSSLASTNLSMAVRAHLLSFTAGAAGSCNGRNDQNLRASGRMTYFPSALLAAVATTAFGHFAPAFTQASRSAICASFSLLPIGIFKFGSECLIAVMSRLFSGAPGVSAAPRFPPLASASALSSRSPPMADSVWQPKQLVANTGRTLLSKKSGESAVTPCAKTPAPNTAARTSGRPTIPCIQFLFARTKMKTVASLRHD